MPGYPFETKMISYYAATYGQLIAHAIKNNSNTQSANFESGLVGANPYFNGAKFPTTLSGRMAYFEHFLIKIPARLRREFREIIVDYYRIVRTQGGKPKAKYFAEKSSDTAEFPRSFARLLWPSVREVVTMRDPRDLFASQVAFFKQYFGKSVGVDSLDLAP